jgi:hypothetical protein
MKSLTSFSVLSVGDTGGSRRRPLMKLGLLTASRPKRVSAMSWRRQKASILSSSSAWLGMSMRAMFR